MLACGHRQVVGQPKPLMLKAKGKTIFLILKNKKMETKKMSLANITGKLSRGEMKNIMAGTTTTCAPDGQSCPNAGGNPDGCCGTCKKSQNGFYACYPS